MDDIGKSFNDPVALKTSWTPLEGGGSNFHTNALVEARPDRLEFRATRAAWLFIGVFAAGAVFWFGAALSQFHARSGATAFLGLFGLVFLGISAGLARSLGRARVFDRREGKYWVGRQPPTVAMDAGACQLGQIHALQVLGQRVRQKGNSHYFSYELNLVLKDGRRIPVVDHGDAQHLAQDVARLARFLGCKVWDAAGMGVAAASASAATTPPQVSTAGRIARAVAAVLAVAFVSWVVWGHLQRPADPPAPMPAVEVTPALILEFEPRWFVRGSTVTLRGLHFGTRANHVVVLDCLYDPQLKRELEVLQWSATEATVRLPADVPEQPAFRLRIHNLKPERRSNIIAFQFQAGPTPEQAAAAASPRARAMHVLDGATGAGAPRIDSALPREAEKGETVTLQGVNFGKAANHAVLLFGSGWEMPMDVVRWSATSVTVRVPDDPLIASGDWDDLVVVRREPPAFSAPHPYRVGKGWHPGTWKLPHSGNDGPHLSHVEDEGVLGGYAPGATFTLWGRNMGTAATHALHFYGHRMHVELQPIRWTAERITASLPDASQIPHEGHYDLAIETRNPRALSSATSIFVNGKPSCADVPTEQRTACAQAIAGQGPCAGQQGYELRGCLAQGAPINCAEMPLKYRATCEQGQSGRGPCAGKAGADLTRCLYLGPKP